jgi:hypothetical protein
MTFLRVTLASALVLGAGILSVEMSPAEAQQARPQVRTQPNAARLNLPPNTARIPSANARPAAPPPSVNRPAVGFRPAVPARPVPTSSSGLVGNAGGTFRR